MKTKFSYGLSLCVTFFSSLKSNRESSILQFLVFQVNILSSFVVKISVSFFRSNHCILFLAFVLIVQLTSGQSTQFTYLDFECDELPYHIEIIGYTGTAETVIIPSEIKGKPVKVIEGADVFDDSSNTKNLHVPSSVVSIATFAFRNMAALESVTLNEGLEEIGTGAFQNCDNLKVVTLPNSLESLRASAFEDCDSLTEVGISSSRLNNLAIPNRAFFSCDSLKTISFINVASIGEEAFEDCVSLTKLDVFSDEITEIGSRAFRGCSGLRYVRIPNNITIITGLSFSGCTALKYVQLGESVTSLNTNAFHSCHALEKVDFGDVLYSISEGVFEACTSLKRVLLPASVVILGADAFSECDFVEFQGRAPAVSSLSSFKDTAIFIARPEHYSSFLSRSFWNENNVVKRMKYHDANADENVDAVMQNFYNSAVEVNMLSLNNPKYSLNVSIDSSKAYEYSPDVQVIDSNDFNQDDNVDIVVRLLDDSNRYVIKYLDSNGSILSEKSFGPFRDDIRLISGADFNNDGIGDLLFQSTSTGAITLFLLKSDGFAKGISRLVSSIDDWRVVATNDYNSDGYVDLIWDALIGGKRFIAVWYLNESYEKISSALIAAVDPTRKLVEVSDYNHDQNMDLLWQNTATLDLDIWYMDYRNVRYNLGDVQNPKKWLYANWKSTFSPVSSSLSPDRNDYNRDGFADLFWQNTDTDVVSCWHLNGNGTRINTSQIANGDANDQLVGVDDMNRDGYNDLIFYQTGTQGNVYAKIWLGSENGEFSAGNTYPEVTSEWKLVGTGDLDGDNNKDLIWQNSNSGRLSVWYLNASGARTRSGILVNWMNEWRVATVVDYNGDGNDDIVWQRNNNGRIRQVSVWYMDGNGVRTSNAAIATLPDPSWSLIGVADYNEDDVLDLLWQKQDTGKLVCWTMNASGEKTGSLVLSGAIAGWRIGHWIW